MHHQFSSKRHFCTFLTPLKVFAVVVLKRKNKSPWDLTKIFSNKYCNYIHGTTSGKKRLLSVFNRRRTCFNSILVFFCILWHSPTNSSKRNSQLYQSLSKLFYQNLLNLSKVFPNITNITSKADDDTLVYRLCTFISLFCYIYNSINVNF